MLTCPTAGLSSTPHTDSRPPSVVTIIWNLSYSSHLMTTWPVSLAIEGPVPRCLHKFWEGIFLKIGLDFGTFYFCALWWPSCIVRGDSLAEVRIQSGQNKLMTPSCSTLASATRLCESVVGAGGWKDTEPKRGRPAPQPRLHHVSPSFLLRKGGCWNTLFSRSFLASKDYFFFLIMLSMPFLNYIFFSAQRDYLLHWNK